MAIPALLQGLSLPVIAAPMLIVSLPELLLAQCKAGVVGSLPALNARPQSQLDGWLKEIRADLTAHQRQHPDAVVAPFAINQILHASNARMEQDLRVTLDHRVPILLTSLRVPPREIVDEVHGYGGIILHDVVNVRHGVKALDAGVDGLVLVAAGAGGHGGTWSPFALVAEMRRLFDGPLVLSGAIAHGGAILAAQAMGADLAYVGTRFIASLQANASAAYKDMLVDSTAADIVYTQAFTGVPGNFLRGSIVAAGLDPLHLPMQEGARMDFSAQDSKVWRDIWGAGQGVGLIDTVCSVSDIVSGLQVQYHAARRQLEALWTARSSH